MIRVGNHVVIQKIGGEHLRICSVAKGRRILIERLRFEINGAIDQPFGLFEVSAGKISPTPVGSLIDIGTAFDLDASASSPSIASTSSCCASLQPLAEGGIVNVEHARQRVTQDEIIKMKDTGVTAGQLIAKLVDGNVSFAERTCHSKHKYINRKAKKHGDRFLILKPTVRLIAESYYRRDPDRLAHLRNDQLSLMLLMGNLRAGAKCLVFEQCLGLVSAAVIDRLGGCGMCIHLHRGNIVQSIPCVDCMDFDQQMLSTFLPLPITSWLKCSHADDVPDIVSESSMDGHGVHDEEKLERPQSMSERTELDCDLIKKDGNDGELSSDVQMPGENNGRMFMRCKIEEVVRGLIRGAELDVVLIAMKNVDPIEILEKAWPSLRLSAAVVVYSPISQPLLRAYQWLRSRGAIQLHIYDSFCRSHQILLGRTHPVMQQLVNGGYILSALKVELRAGRSHMR